MRIFRGNDRDYVGEDGFGSSPKASKSVGSVWVVRADGIPLPLLHVQALVGYIRDKVEPRLANALSGVAPGEVVADREAVLDSITKAEFAEYYDNFKAMKVRHDPGWARLPSPYEMTEGFVGAIQPVIARAIRRAEVRRFSTAE